MGRRPVKDQRREQILEGLFEAMAREGTRGASITEIAEAAGIARGALHYYFESKDEIREALMRRLGDGYLEGLSRALERARERDAADEDAVLRALVRYHFAGDTERNERLVSVWIDFWGHAPSDPRLNAVVLFVQEGARELCLRALLSRRPDLDALSDDDKRHAAAGLLALIEGALLQWRVAARSERPLQPLTLAARVTDAALAYARHLPEPHGARHARSA